MKKILTLALLSFLLVSCGTKNGSNEGNNGSQNSKKTEKVIEKYGDLTKYIKSDINDVESKNLIAILEQRKEIQSEIKEIIGNVTTETIDESYNTIIEKRKILTEQILPFIADTKIGSFQKYFENINYRIKIKLDEVK